MRLIDGDALIYAIEKRMDDVNREEFAEGMSESILEVKFSTTIDAVPVVRCKDCKWWAGDGSDTVAECSNCGGDWRADEYCSDGERREDEAD